MTIRIALLGLLLPLVAAAQAPRKQTPAARVPANTPAPRIDGRLDDAAWVNAPFAADFTARDPVEGAAPKGPTRIAFAYDDDALYVAARMDGERPGDVQALLTRRDDMGASEMLIVSLDTYLDRRTAYSFGVTSGGGRLDYYQPTDGQHSGEMGYNPVWEARTTVDSAGWTAELRIPFSQLRFTDAQEQQWGLNVERYVPARNEDLYWVMIPKHETGWSSRFGNLVGINGIRPSRRLEIVPYGATNATVTGSRDPANPFDDGRNLKARGGADLKVGLGPSLTLDATANPDFGQVEADPAEVNLSAFPTFFSEKRPFFAEGSDLLQMAGLFYTRRIGAPPHGGASATFLSRPQNSTILGAAKLSGRLTPSLSIAALGALTDREYARTFDVTTGQLGRVRIEPVTAYGAARVVKRFGAAGSTIGVMLTGVHRDLGAADPLRGILTRDAWSGGANGTLRFSRGVYEARWTAAWSHLRGDTAAVRRIQQASSHYLQRPDASEGGYAPTRTSLTGYTVVYRFEKLGGRHWLWDIGGELESPTYEINDIGRLTAANDVDNYADLRFRQNTPSRSLYSYTVGLSSRVGYNFGGVRQNAIFSLNPSLVWRNYLQTSASVAVELAAVSDALTRGGPLMGTPRVLRMGASVQTNDRVTTYGSVSGDYRNDDLGGWGYGVNLNLTTRPTGQWGFSVAPRYQRSVDSRQYLATRPGGSASTYGQRYIFSFIDRGTLSAQVRASYLLQPDLTVELYAEPFAANGRYYAFGELPASRSRNLRTYGTAGTTVARGADGSVLVVDGAASFALPNPDFNIVSFNSNVVLRWEWRPGSTLFLVWQQSRSGIDPRGDLVGPGRLWDAVTARGDNFLAFKVTYWLPAS
ncbi:MAG: hypothetical protein EXR93_08610 [Gemmatimonadetes bacterium]|nr:hypothetical protein [Gemmatimonadota bacterium]